MNEFMVIIFLLAGLFGVAEKLWVDLNVFMGLFQFHELQNMEITGQCYCFENLSTLRITKAQKTLDFISISNHLRYRIKEYRLK